VTVDWVDVEAHFEPDGSLLDIYVSDVTVQTWDTLVRHLGIRFELTFEIDGRPSDLPIDVGSLFGDGIDRATRLLRVHRTSDPHADVNIHFFLEDEIEMDLEPSVVHDQATLDELIEFMADVASAVNRPVALTPENTSTRPILTVDRAGSTRRG